MNTFTPYQEFIFKTRYARWIESEKRREDWPEAVARYMNFFSPRIPEDVRKKTVAELEKAILNLDVMPSMRALQTAGKALERDQVAQFNCTFTAINDVRVFSEILYLSACTCGVGFSVERQFVNSSELPCVADTLHPTDTVIKVRDSKIGWANALRELMALLYQGMIPTWDTSAVRPKGAKLKTMGGRASGPEPLEELFNHVVRIFKGAAGRKLTSLECHDIVCYIASAIVVGGVRRSATISLSNLSDDRMRDAKSGQWWEQNGQRALANNSAVYTERPEIGIFMKEWMALYASKSGERGIFNRKAATLQAKKTGRRKWEGETFGTNPCSEILLRSSGQMCNLTEVIVRPEDDEESLKDKVRLATILGTLQSTLTNFRYLRKIWQKNCEEERLLGVSITGIMDNPLTYTNDDNLKAMLERLKQHAIEVNKEWAERLGINQSVSITCVKPSGTVSSMCGTSSGIHPAYGRYILRSVRNDVKDPVTDFLKAIGVPWEPDAMKPNDTVVFYFPLKAAEHAVLRTGMTAIDQLELHHTYRNFWAEHSVSNTIYVREQEWLEVAAWVYKHFDEIGGLSFLPYSDHIYKQAPFQEINEEEYNKRVQEMPVIDWKRLPEFEVDDATTSSREVACSSGVCDLL